MKAHVEIIQVTCFIILQVVSQVFSKCFLSLIMIYSENYNSIYLRVSPSGGVLYFVKWQVPEKSFIKCSFISKLINHIFHILDI